MQEAMDKFWTEVLGVSDPNVEAKWQARGQNIEQKVREAVVQNGMRHDDDWADDRVRALGQVPFRCLEIGTYCGYSALRIARNLPDNGTLLSVEKDPLFAAIATKIVEFAGLEKKVKVWMGAIDTEIANVEGKMESRRADFVLCDHSLERYIVDLNSTHTNAQAICPVDSRELWIVFI